MPTHDRARGPRVLAVCVVHADRIVPGRVGRTAIDKRPVPGRVEIGPLGLAGDHVCNTADHGGVHQAVYAYAEEDARLWAQELDRELPAGWFGENLRIEGMAVSDAVLGARWAIGDTLLEVSAPRVPCATFGHVAGEARWVKRFTDRAHTGAYLRVLETGTIGAGDRVEVVHEPAHGVTVREVFTGTDIGRLALLLATEPTVSADVRTQIDRHARRHGVPSPTGAPFPVGAASSPVDGPPGSAAGALAPPAAGGDAHSADSAGRPSGDCAPADLTDEVAS